MADTPRSNEVIDKINEFKKAHGEEPIAYEIVDQEAELAKKKQEEEAANSETERLRIEAENKAKGSEGNPPAPPAKVELTKEEKEAIAMEIFGVTDLKELVKKSEIKKEPTPEETAAEKEQRENNKYAYALNKGKVSKKQLENFIVDSKNPINLVLAQYSKEQKEIDSTLTDEEIENEFNAKYGLDNKEDTRQYKRGLKEINILAENILKQSYAPIYSIDSEYDAFESQQLTQKQLADKLISEAPVYKKTVEEIYSGLKKLDFDLGDDGKYQVEMPDEIINSLKDRELTNEYAAKQITNGYTKEEKALSAKLTLIYENLPTIVKSLADKINHKKQAGSKGIPPIGDNNPKPPAKQLTKEQQESVDRIYGKQGTPVAN